MPERLKYAVLGTNETFHVIAADLTKSQEETLPSVLRDIKGISPTIVQHIIHLIYEAQSMRDLQRRLNPIIKVVVKKDILKSLDNGIIYSISDSAWVSPVQVVPKKFGTPVIQNNDNKLIHTRVQTRWRVCIDYRKPNVTRKDHFCLPFMDHR